MSKPPYQIGHHAVYVGKTYIFPGVVCGLTDDDPAQVILRATLMPYRGMKNIYGQDQLHDWDGTSPGIQRVVERVRAEQKQSVDHRQPVKVEPPKLNFQWVDLRNKYVAASEFGEFSLQRDNQGWIVRHGTKIIGQRLFQSHAEECANARLAELIRDNPETTELTPNTPYYWVPTPGIKVDHSTHPVISTDDLARQLFEIAGNLQITPVDTIKEVMLQAGMALTRVATISEPVVKMTVTGNAIETYEEFSAKLDRMVKDTILGKTDKPRWDVDKVEAQRAEEKTFVDKMVDWPKKLVWHDHRRDEYMREKYLISEALGVGRFRIFYPTEDRSHWLVKMPTGRQAPDNFVMYQALSMDLAKQVAEEHYQRIKIAHEKAQPDLNFEFDDDD